MSFCKKCQSAISNIEASAYDSMCNVCFNEYIVEQIDSLKGQPSSIKTRGN